MSKIFILEPEVPGGLGPRTIMNRSVHPPLVSALHFVFDSWGGDQIVTSFPCYLVTPGLAASLAAAGVTGYELSDAEVEVSDEFKEWCPERSLPDFKWFRVVGTESVDDVYFTADNLLAGTQKVLDVILATNPSDFEFYET